MLEKLKGNKFLIFIIYYGLIYMALSVYHPFIGVYYLNLGFNMSQIGIFAAIGPVLSILVQPIWGIASDRARYRDTVLRVSLGGAAISALLYPASTSYIYVLLITIVYVCFNTAAIPLGDAITLSHITNTKYRFAPIRLAGTVGYAVMVFFVGRIVKNQVSYIFYINSGILFITLFHTWLFPKEVIKQNQKRSGRVSDIVKDKTLIFLFFYSFIVFTALSFHSSFASVYLKSLNATNAYIGLAMSISAFSEVPILLIIDKVMKKISPRTILLFSGLMTGVRMLIFSKATSLPVLLASQTLQGVTFITIYYCSVLIVNNEIPDNLKSTGQSILAIVRGGFASVIGSIAGGYMSQHLGVQSVFFIAFCFVTVMTVIIIGQLVLRLWKSGDIFKSVKQEAKGI
jgi:MFS transporter, PPP family, 3-phenylpropionic acid transporter